jgi:KAP family P-loop domain
MSTGYDTPADASGDALERWPFARQVYRLLVDLPSDWSVRIGVHGEWGSGKTTVLNYVRNLAHEDNHVVVTLSPWTARTQEELWQLILIELTRSLSEHGITLKHSAFAKFGSAWAQKKGLSDLAKSFSKIHPIAKVFTNTFFILLQRMLEADGER